MKMTPFFLPQLEARDPLARTRLERYRQQSGRCFYCDDPMWERVLEDGISAAERLGIKRFTPRSGKLLRYRLCTAEHLIRRAEGGKDHPENIVAACQLCNTSRGHMPWADFRRLKRRMP